MFTENYVIDEFDRKKFEDIYSTSTGDNNLFVWSHSEMKLLQKINPLLARKINNSVEIGLDYFVADEDLDAQARYLVSFFNSNLDNQIFNGTVNAETINSYFGDFDRMLEAQGKKNPISKSTISKSNVLQLAMIMKKYSLSVAEELFTSSFEGDKLVNSSNMIEGLDAFVNIFGNKLERIIQYGPGVQDAKKGASLILLLSDINGVYDVAFGKKEKVKLRNEDYGERKFGVIFFPSKTFNQYLEGDPYSLKIAFESRVIYGDSLKVPYISKKKLIQNNALKAGKALVGFRCALSNRHKIENLVENPKMLYSLLESELFVQRAIYMHYFGSAHENDYLSKEGLYTFIKPTRISYDEVKQTLLNVNYRLSEKIKKWSWELEHDTRDYQVKSD